MRSFTDYIGYNQYRRNITKKHNAALTILLPIVSFLVLFIALKDSRYYLLFSFIPWLIYSIIVPLFFERSLKSFSILTDKYYRTKNYPLCIFIIVWSSIALLSNIGTCVTILAITQINKSNILGFVMLILYCISAISTFCTVLNFTGQWIKTLRWEYDELSLSSLEKEKIMKKEKTEYINFKRENKNFEIAQRAERRAEQKQYVKDSIQNIKDSFIQKFTFKNTNGFGDNSTSRLTKYDKLEELNELYKNGFISKAELEKARADILGK